MDTEIDKLCELKTRYSSFIEYASSINVEREQYSTIPVAVSTLIKYLECPTVSGYYSGGYGSKELTSLSDVELGIAYILSDVRIPLWIKRDLARMFLLKWGKAYIPIYRNVNSNKRRKWCIFS